MKGRVAGVMSVLLPITAQEQGSDIAPVGIGQFACQGMARAGAARATRGNEPCHP